ncbi:MULTISPECIES: CAP domain-containing protein [unclassified Butyrivibrio]|uniref:CAP domain-containing protein n=1 Tax=unclassified Butyrivibrio TaxID=2639466 RepID=UPI0003B314D3|nr:MULTISPECIES: CAP domain-containing protein [unclassified Butyrivibrio]
MNIKSVFTIKSLSARIISTAMVTMMAVSSALTSPIPVHAESIVTYQVTGTYEQTSARNMLKAINDFRTGSEAWAWNESNTQKVRYTGLSNLVYDYDLEKTAMQRAMEISVLFEHTRPNGSQCFSAYSQYMYAGENIAYGYSSADSVFRAWQETDDPYEGQGHRRNMLGQGFTCVAVGHVIRNGTHYWVQEFRSPTVSTAATPATNSTQAVNVDCLSSKIKSGTSVSRISLDYGETYDLSKVQEAVFYESIYRPIQTKPISSFSVSDSYLIEIDKSTLKGKNAGSATIDGSLSNGSRFSIPVTVNPVNMYFVDSESIPAQTATGSAVTPDVSLTYNGTPLVNGVDYTVSYSNNVKPGYAYAIVTGKGNFTGTKQFMFYIMKSSKNENSGKESSEKAPKKVDSFTLAKGKRSFSISWDKVSGASKYEIQYATNKKFSDAKTKTFAGSKSSAKIKKLKSGKKYFVRIRCYKNIYGMKVYSGWSKTKKIKVK